MKMFNSVSYDFIRLSVQKDKNVKNIETRLQNKMICNSIREYGLNIE